MIKPLEYMLPKEFHNVIYEGIRNGSTKQLRQIMEA